MSAATGPTGPVTGVGGTGPATAASTPAPAPAPAVVEKKTEEIKKELPSWTAGMSGIAVAFWFIVSVLFMIVFHYGAAVLSYSRYQSVFWAIIDFVFAVFYYPYYALVLNRPAPVAVMGARRRHA